MDTTANSLPFSNQRAAGYVLGLSVVGVGNSAEFVVSAGCPGFRIPLRQLPLIASKRDNGPRIFYPRRLPLHLYPVICTLQEPSPRDGKTSSIDMTVWEHGPFRVS